MHARVQYNVPGLDEDSVAATPLAQFALWIEAAASAGIPEPNAMSLATTGSEGPSVRVVLAKDVDEIGIRFFTNLESDKAREIAHDDRVAAVFSWITQHRQVRFRGNAQLLPREDNEAYFAGRPRGAQLGAWASQQSQVIGSRATLQEGVDATMRRFPEGSTVPLPDNWGGYLIRPIDIEFWQGQPSRLHDRLRFTAITGSPRLDDPDAWRRERLAP